MTIRQLHYTSCRQGRDGIDGFQVAASTPNVLPRHEQLALPLAAYRPGPGAPPTPTADEVAAFPVALGYRRFDDVAVLFHSRYLGADFSGRQGNYFAHVLVLDRATTELAGRCPAEMWASPLWTWQETGRPDLPVLDTLPAGPFAHRERVRADLARIPAFLVVVDAVVRALAGGPPVALVAADVADVAVALTAVTRSLPTPLAAAVSFTTFSSTPAETDLLVVGTTPDVVGNAGSLGERCAIPLAAPSDDPAPYGLLVGRCWAAGSRAVDELVGLANRIQPALRAEELGAFAPLAELILFGGTAGTAVGAVEFAAHRYPAGLNADLWRRVDEAVAAAGRAGDVVRWSAAIIAARRAGPDAPGPVLQAAYLESVLAGVEAGGLDPAGLWLPEGPVVQASVEGWAAAAIRGDPSLARADRVLRTVNRLAVRLSDPELREIADLVLIPHLVDPGDEAAPERMRALPHSDRLLGFVYEQLERRLADDELFDAAACGLSPGAAELLRSAAPPESRCATVARLALARAGRRDRAATLRRAVGAESAHELARYVDLIWPDLPSAADAATICRSFEPSVVARSGVAALLVRSLVAHARDSEAAGDGGLARALSAVPITEALTLAEAEVVRAARLTELFRDRPVISDDAAARAAEAARLAERVEPAVGDRVADTVAAWLLAQRHTAFHAGVLAATVVGPPADRFLSRYGGRLRVLLAGADPAIVAAILPAVAVHARFAPRMQHLLDTACAEGLRQRRKRELDQVGRALKDQREALATVAPPPPARDWPAWWDDWRAARLSRSTQSGLRIELPWRRAGGR